MDVDAADESILIRTRDLSSSYNSTHHSLHFPPLPARYSSHFLLSFLTSPSPSPPPSPPSPSSSPYAHHYSQPPASAAAAVATAAASAHHHHHHHKPLTLSLSVTRTRRYDTDCTSGARRSGRFSGGCRNLGCSWGSFGGRSGLAGCGRSGIGCLRRGRGAWLGWLGGWGWVEGGFGVFSVVRRGVST